MSVRLNFEGKKEGRCRREKNGENVAGRLLNGRFMCFYAYAVRLCAYTYVHLYIHNRSFQWTTTYE